MIDIFVDEITSDLAGAPELFVAGEQRPLRELQAFPNPSLAVVEGFQERSRVERGFSREALHGFTEQELGRDVKDQASEKRLHVHRGGSVSRDQLKHSLQVDIERLKISNLLSGERRLDQGAGVLPERAVTVHDPLSDKGFPWPEPEGLQAPVLEIGGEDGPEVVRLDGEDARGAVRLPLEGGSVGLDLLLEGDVAAPTLVRAEQLQHDIQAENWILLRD